MRPNEYQVDDRVIITGGVLPDAIGKTGWVIGINPGILGSPVTYIVEVNGKLAAFYGNEITKTGGANE